MAFVHEIAMVRVNQHVRICKSLSHVLHERIMILVMMMTVNVNCVVVVALQVVSEGVVKCVMQLAKIHVILDVVLHVNFVAKINVR